METVRFQCPSCGKNLRARRETLGRKAKCPACGRVVQVRTTSSATAEQVGHSQGGGTPSRFKSMPDKNQDHSPDPDVLRTASDSKFLALPKSLFRALHRRTLGKPSNEQRKAIFEAVSAGEPGAVQRLLDAAPELVKARINRVKWNDERDKATGPQWDATPLHWAAQYGFRRVAEVLVARGAQVNGKDNDGKTPLHHLGFLGYDDDEEFEDDGPHYVAEILLEHGADVNARDKSGSTPLMEIAGHAFQDETVNVLLAHGAKANVHDRTGVTPLHRAVLSCAHYEHPEAMQRMQRIIGMLIAAGADVNARTVAGETPLFWVKQNLREAEEAGNQKGVEDASAIAQFLLANGAKD